MNFPEDFPRSIPDIPFEIFSLAAIEPDLTYAMRCSELWKEVCEELASEAYRPRAHHNASTYDQGCRGPLCRKANREHPRRRKLSSITVQLQEDRVYDPVLEYFHTVMKFRVKKYQLQMMEKLA